MDWNSIWDKLFFIFNPTGWMLEINVVVDDGIILTLTFEAYCLSLVAWQIQWCPTVLFLSNFS